MTKKGNALIVGLDIVGFALLLVGGAMIRFASGDIFSIIGGFVLAGGVAVISLTRLIPK